MNSDTIHGWSFIPYADDAAIPKSQNGLSTFSNVLPYGRLSTNCSLMMPIKAAKLLGITLTHEW